MKSRPTIALACILKNEAANIGPLINSVRGCFDAIFMTDTGSADTSVDILKNPKTAEIAGCPIHVSHFTWVNDFSKARQFCFDQVGPEYDYIMWLDLDDVLNNREAFIHFRDHTMHCCQQWLVPYRYAFNANGQSICTFNRERIIKNNYGFKWHYFVHEGILPAADKKVATHFISTFSVDHMRTDQDVVMDRNRNLALFKDREAELDSRMKYYWGKELFEAHDYIKCIQVLGELCKSDDPKFSIADRVMSMQYLAMAYSQCMKWAEALKVSLLGLQLSPDRGEFFNLAADALLRQSNHQGAIVFYKAAKNCAADSFNGFIYNSPQAVRDYPCVQLANIYIQMGRWREAKAEVEALKSFGSPEAARFEPHLRQAEHLNSLGNEPKVKTDDIVISTPPHTITEDWDEHTLKTVGTGGSETAAIEVARQLKLKTGRTVRVYMKRKTVDLMPSGVEYYPINHLEDYFRKYEPKAHIAWRHAVRLTNAPSFVWSHDLVTPGAEQVNNYTKLWCLTPFHKEFVKDMQGIVDSKISLVKNGLDPEVFEAVKDAVKNPNKVVFSSSPDRGLERCIEIVRRARKDLPDLELHIFYGPHNIRKSGNHAEADRLEKLMRDNDFVKYHGFVPKVDLMRHMREAAVHLYPADFIETSCLTVLEAACNGTYVLTRNMGAIPYTLKEVHERGMCEILDVDASGDEEFQIWADSLVTAIRDRKWEKVDVSVDNYSWSKVTDDFIKEMGL